MPLVLKLKRFVGLQLDGAKSVALGVVLHSPLERNVRQRWLTVVIASVCAFVCCQLIEAIILRWLGLSYFHLCRFDCGWYTSIVNNWYHSEGVAHPKLDAANWAFFPLFPSTAILLKMLLKTFIKLPSEFALLATSKMYFLCAITAFTILVKKLQPKISAWTSAFVAALHPMALYGNAGYAEPAFLLGSSLFFSALLKNQFVLSGVFGAFASATRLAGLFLSIACLCRLFRARGYSWEAPVLGGLLIPLGLCVFSFILYFANGDGLAFAHVQIAWNRTISNPLIVLHNALHGSTRDVASAVMTIAALAAIGYLFVSKRFELAAFSLIATLVPLSAGIQSMPRFLWWQVPLLFVVVQLCDYRISRVMLLPLFIAALIFNYYAFLTDWVEFI